MDERELTEVLGVRVQSNSEHGRHWFFTGRLVIDGKEVRRNTRGGCLVQSSVLVDARIADEARQEAVAATSEQQRETRWRCELRTSFAARMRRPSRSATTRARCEAAPSPRCCLPNLVCERARAHLRTAS